MPNPLSDQPRSAATDQPALGPDDMPENVVYLDDREPPLNDSWFWAQTVAELISELRRLRDAGESAAHLSLDFDLRYTDGENTGVDALRQIAELDLWPTASIHLHSGLTENRELMAELVLASGRFDEEYQDTYVGWRYLARQDAESTSSPASEIDA